MESATSQNSNNTTANYTPTKEKRKGRVKVYQLDSQGQWEDKGTGYVVCTFLQVF